MRKRDVKIGMEVEHVKSGKYLGRVTGIAGTLIQLDGPSPIATVAEMTPRVLCQPISCETDFSHE